MRVFHYIYIYIDTAKQSNITRLRRFASTSPLELNYWNDYLSRILKIKLVAIFGTSISTTSSFIRAPSLYCSLSLARAPAKIDRSISAFNVVCMCTGIHTKWPFVFFSYSTAAVYYEAFSLLVPRALNMHAYKYALEKSSFYKRLTEQALYYWFFFFNLNARRWM